MMLRGSHPTVSGLRTRFMPRARLGHGLVTMGPWVDLVLLLLFYVILTSQFVIQPGVIIDLPESKVAEGVRMGMTMVVLSPVSSEKSATQVAFFDDERFLIDRAEHLERLKNRLALKVQRFPESGLTVLADGNVAHAVIVALVEIAREAGVKSVNVAVRPAR